MSGLWIACGSGRSENIQMLVEALQKKCANAPQQLIDALRAAPQNDISTPEQRLRITGRKESADRIASAIDAAFRQMGMEPVPWVPNISKEEFLTVCRKGHDIKLKDYLAAGYDPDTRNDAGVSGLFMAAAAGKGLTVAILVNSLQEKYKNKPAKLIQALEVGDKGISPEQALRNNDCTSEANNIAHTIAAARQALEALAHLPPTPRSELPLPVKCDRTLTAVKLQELKGERTNLEILGAQGQLVDAFTADIWMGRREEMEEAWAQVSPEHHNQVDIEVVRGALAQAGVRERFPRADSRKKGF